MLSLSRYRVLRSLFAALVFVTGVAIGAFNTRAEAQGYAIMAGSSNLTGVDGLTVTKYDGSRTSMMSIGGAGNSLVFGAATEYKRDNGILRYGDTAIGFTLPTDLDSAGRSVGARGVQWSHLSTDQTFKVFMGKTGSTMQFGYINAITTARWMGSVEWGRRLSSKLDLSGVAAAGAAHAAIAGLTYHQTHYREYGVTLGWNAGHPVIAVSAKMRGESWSLMASETVGRLQLRPQTTSPYDALQYDVPEREGLNFTFEKKFTSWLQLDASRTAYGKDVLGGLPNGAQMYDVGFTAMEGNLSQSLRMFESYDGDTNSQGAAFVARYRKQYWEFDASLMESWRQNKLHLDDGRTQSTSMTATRSFLGRYKLTGGANFSGSQPNFLAGADIAGPWGSVGVTESMMYVPFGLQAGFTKVTMISLKMHPKNVVDGTVNMLMGKNVPWSYTAIANTFIEHGGSGGQKAQFKAKSLSVPQYVLRGVVVDQVGAPVADAAVRVGDTIVYTDDAGAWEYRQKKPIAVSLHVAPEDFITVKKYASDEAVQQVVPDKDDQAKPIVMHVFYQNPTKHTEKTTVTLHDTPGTVGTSDSGPPKLKINEGLLGQFEQMVLHGGVE